MKRRSLPIVFVLAALGALAAGRLVSHGQEDKKKKEMEALQAYRTPGKEHAFLAKRAGKWEYSGRMWMAPGALPSPIKGKSEFKLIMGGRFLVDETEGDAVPESGEQRFQGVGFTGFDNLKRKYVSAWIDTMGTGIMTFEGDLSADGKELTFTGQQPDLMGLTGKALVKVRTLERILSEDRFTFETHVPGPDGKEFKNFELEYTRKR